MFCEEIVWMNRWVVWLLSWNHNYKKEQQKQGQLHTQLCLSHHMFFLFIIKKWRKKIQSCKELLHNNNAPNIMDFVKNVLCILDHID